MVKFAVGVAVLIAAPALGAPREGEPGYDPDRILCKSKPVVGSRVKRVRECHSVQQWEELQRQERLGLLRRQTNGDAGCNNDPAGYCGITNGGRDTPF